MLSAGFRDSEAGVTERYGQEAARRKLWELGMPWAGKAGASAAKEAFLFFSRESGGRSSATVIMVIKPPVGIMLN